MTMPASYAEPFGGRLPSQNEKDAANQLRQILASRQADGEETRLKIATELGKTSDIVLSPMLSALLMDVLRHVGRGDAVTLVPVGQMLTTQQAADILNVSRPFLIGLLERGDIEHHHVGRHRRVRAEHLFEYKRKRDEMRSKALSDLAETDADLL